MKMHITILGWLQVALGLLDLLLALAVFGVLAGAGVLLGLAGEGGLSILGGVLGTILGFLVVLTGIPNLVAGYGLLAGRSWSRIVTLILAVFNILKVPWGTVLAVYTIWVLTTDEAKEILTG